MVGRAELLAGLFFIAAFFCYRNTIKKGIKKLTVSIILYRKTWLCCWVQIDKKSLKYLYTIGCIYM